MKRRTMLRMPLYGAFAGLAARTLPEVKTEPPPPPEPKPTPRQRRFTQRALADLDATYVQQYEKTLLELMAITRYT